ncbi:MAG: 16S rRNA (adenine(1518)-N(6)/adenine(1519)-N(6))-dimethyltransferase RsmA [Flammeovirgaceae bacterium]
MAYVKPKKKLGQHFLKDQSIAQQIVDLLSGHQNYKYLLEIGPGTGVLTKLLLPSSDFQLRVIEIDTESVDYLLKELKVPAHQIVEGDFLRLPATSYFGEEAYAIIGNFPYNISSQIFFKVLENRDQIKEVVGMLQKEVAERICAKPGGKTCGILSIFMQAFYDCEYHFTVPPEVFNPPPKVQSGVLRLRRNDTKKLDCDEKWFFKIVKQGFNNRRKTLRNALKSLNFPKELMQDEVFSQRAEQLSVQDFVLITKQLAS